MTENAESRGPDVLRNFKSYQQVSAYVPAPAGVRTVEGLTRDEACHMYHRKVLLLARRLSDRLPPDASMQYDDLVSCGAIGLLEAFDRYDDERGIQFSTFAEYRIRGAMLDALRQGDTFTRRRRQLAKRVAYAQSELKRELGREPTPEECADALGMDLEEYWKAVDKVQPVNLVSIDAQQDDEGEDSRSLLDVLVTGSVDEADRQLLGQEVRQHLREAIKGLPERHRHCVLMYYGKDMSLAEIAEVYGVTPSRISQILSDGRKRLRKAIEHVVDRSDLAL